MSGALHAWVRRWWAGDAGALGALATFVTAPLEWLYRRAVTRRNARYDVRGGMSVEGLRVVSLGNLSVGGTGKTPLAGWLARRLADTGMNVALVARGYGRDELMLHHRWNPDVPVVADPDRVKAARQALQQGAELAVLDDAFQHRRLARNVDLVLVAASDPYPARLLPRGPFREPSSSLSRAHGVIVTRRVASEDDAKELARRVSAEHPHLAMGVVALLPGGWQNLDGTPAEAPTDDVLCVTAVARPAAFALQAEMAIGVGAELMAWPDHHEYTEHDARAIRARAGDRTVVTTEKDAVKLLPFEALIGSARVMVQALRWEEGEERIAELVTSVLGRKEGS